MKLARTVPLVSLSLALLSPFAGTARGQSPNPGPSHLLPGAPVVDTAVGWQTSAAVCAGATSSLLVFDDDRTGDQDIFGVRLDANGVAIDPVPFRITTDPGDQRSPRVAWNGQNWIVVYSDQVDPGSGYFAYETAARRVSPLGQVLDADRILIGPDNQGGNVGVGSDGTNWVVAYTGQTAGSSDIRAKRISPAGSVLDPAGVVLFAGPSYALGVAFSQSEYLFTWSDNGLRGRRFTAQLQPIDAAPVLLVPTLLTPDGASVAADGSGFFLAWSFENAWYTADVVGRRLDANLNPVGNPMIAISGSSPTAYSLSPRVVSDGTQWIVAWMTNGTQDARAARVSSAGTVLDPGGVALPDASPNYLYEHALGALPGGGALVAWDDIRSGGGPAMYDVFGIPFGPDGVAGIERGYSVGSESMRHPRVAMGDHEAVVAFRAEAASASRILVQRVGAPGNPIDTEPIVVASATHAGLNAGGVAWNGSAYLVTWSDSSQGKVFARRMLPDGSFLDPSPIFVLLGRDSDVAALGADFLVTGLRAPLYPQFVYSYGARVRGVDGVVLDNPALAIGDSYAARARVATLGGVWIVATERHFSHDDNSSSVLVTLVSPSGVVSPSVVAMFLNIQNWGSVDLASAGTSALVVGQTGSNWTNTDVYARRVEPGGTMPAPMFNVTGAVGLGQSRASVGWSGTEYVVAYESLQNNAWFYDFEPDIYASRVSESGSVIDPVGVPVWDAEDFETRPDAGSMGNGRVLFASSAYVDGAYGAYRIAVRGWRPAGLQNYGTGTPGCAGPQRMDANSAPSIGNAGFTLTCDHAPANAIGLAAIGTVADVPGSDPYGFGVLLHVSVAPPTLVVFQSLFADPAGVASTALPIPPVPSFVGVTLYVQSAFAWPGPCVPSPSGLSTSDGLAVQIQNP